MPGETGTFCVGSRFVLLHNELKDNIITRTATLLKNISQAPATFEDEFKGYKKTKDKATKK